MSVGKFEIKISWGLFSGALCLSVFLAALGFWQLERSGEKQQLQDAIDRDVAAPPVHLTSGIGSDWQKWQYRKIEARGHFGKEFMYYLDNRVHQGKAGYHIIAPFYLETSSDITEPVIILVNRGWVAVGNDRSVIPEVVTPVGSIRLEGRLGTPRSKPTLIGDDEMPDAYSDRIWTYLDIDYVARLNNLKLEPYILLQENTVDDGLKRELPNYDANVTMHIGYAIQWFAFALFVILAFIKSCIKKREL